MLPCGEKIIGVSLSEPHQGPYSGCRVYFMVRTYVPPSPMRMRGGIQRQLSVYPGITGQARFLFATGLEASTLVGKVQTREEKQGLAVEEALKKESVISKAKSIG